MTGSARPAASTRTPAASIASMNTVRAKALGSAIGATRTSGAEPAAIVPVTRIVPGAPPVMLTRSARRPPRCDRGVHHVCRRGRAEGDRRRLARPAPA